MCMCNCSQVLTECNHVGCTTSASMLKELNAALQKGDSEDAITQMFVQEFGTKVYAEPPKSGFSLVAWVMLDRRHLIRLIAEVEAKGVTRRSRRESEEKS